MMRQDTSDRCMECQTYGPPYDVPCRWCGAERFNPRYMAYKIAKRKAERGQ